MSQAREIRGKIANIKGTQKITAAMELVAASKMRKAQERMRRAAPYAQKMRSVISHVATSHSESTHPYLIKRDTVKRVGYIVVSTDRGLCGGLNVNLFRLLMKTLKVNHDQGQEIDVCIIGKKAASFFARHGGNVVGTADHLGDTPKVADLIGVVKVLIDRYDRGELDEIYVISNFFRNTMVQEPVLQQLLPLEPDVSWSQSDTHWDYIYEPDSANELLTQLLVRYIESQVYRAVIENIACEQSARMIAMKSATDNAGDLVDELQLIYNKARQASITQEIAEIVGGADAI